MPTEYNSYISTKYTKLKLISNQKHIKIDLKKMKNEILYIKSNLICQLNQRNQPAIFAAKI